MLLLMGCAADLPPKPRPGVLEAQACMKLLKAPLPNNPEYIVLNCTNNGVWTVERVDLVAGVAVERIDFLNQEYWGDGTEGQLVPFSDLPPDRAENLAALRRNLNYGLLAQKEERLEATGSFLQKLNPF